MKWNHEVVSVAIGGKVVFGGVQSKDVEAIQRVITERGDNGWELVSVTAAGAGGTSHFMLLFFKQPAAD